jgi:hypothetical protein
MGSVRRASMSKGNHEVGCREQEPREAVRSMLPILTGLLSDAASNTEASVSCNSFSFEPSGLSRPRHPSRQPPGGHLRHGPAIIPF